MGGVRRGDVVWMDFTVLHKKRPGVVVQNDVANRLAPHTIVAAIREDVGKGLPVQVAVEAGSAGLKKDSVVDCGFLTTVRSERLTVVGHLTPAVMERVMEALRISLDLV